MPLIRFGFRTTNGPFKTSKLKSITERITMGLDMYLNATKYVSGYISATDSVFNTPETRVLHANLLCAVGLTIDDTKGTDPPSIRIKVQVGYWRKANAIHGWFVDNVQDGEDDCGACDVSREQLQKLLDDCKSAIAAKTSEKVPPRAGFFFGSTDIDDDYWEDLERTVAIVTHILEAPRLKDWDFEYQSSW
jgi:hypothetical protein